MGDRVSAKSALYERANGSTDRMGVKDVLKLLAEVTQSVSLGDVKPEDIHDSFVDILSKPKLFGVDPEKLFREVQGGALWDAMVGKAAEGLREDWGLEKVFAVMVKSGISQSDLSLLKSVDTHGIYKGATLPKIAALKEDWLREFEEMGQGLRHTGGLTYGVQWKSVHDLMRLWVEVEEGAAGRQLTHLKLKLTGDAREYNNPSVFTFTTHIVVSFSLLGGLVVSGWASG